MATEFHSTDQIGDDTDGDLVYCEPCMSFVHFSFTKESQLSVDLAEHRGHYLYPSEAATALKLWGIDNS